jgi:2-(1,2-epoxy-1,2-dihydrophenyl)acetyl-CoA isomerase
VDYKRLKITSEDGLAIITLSDPATLNAASLEMGTELHHALASLSAPDSGARALVLTGEGRGFCSGANLSAGPGPGGGAVDPDGKPDAGKALEHTYNPMVTAMRDLPIPIVTAVNGPAAGVGCSIALMGDIIVAAESAYFLQAFRRIGLVPDGGSTYLLPRLIGKARAMEMALLGEKIPAAKALDWGLINRAVPDAELMPTALNLARELANGPKSLGLIRKAMWASLDAAWLEQLHEERMAQRIAGKTDDFREGVSAFLQKRPAAFQGR